MNENEKNIETCLAESVLAEVANVPTDAQFRSLVEESFDPLQQQALQQAGCDAYKEVVMYHQPYTFTSSVRQMKSNLILLLRRLWRFPFGRGTSLSDAASSDAASSDAGSLRSLADMWQHYITRLSGNETYGIPSRLSKLTDLPSAPALLNDRKISEPNAVDGISLAQIFGGAYMPTSIEDDTHGWTMTSQLRSFENVKIGCSVVNIPAVSRGVPAVTATGTAQFDDVESVYMRDYYSVFLRGGEGETLNFRKLTSIRFGSAYSHFIDNCRYKRLIFPVLTDFRDGNHYYGNSTGIVLNSPGVEYIECDVLPQTNGSGNVNLFYNNASLKEINMPGFTNHNISIMRNCPELTTLRLGKITAWSVPSRGDWDAEYDEFKQEKKLILIEFGQGSAANINLANWSPTLDSSNLQQFLSNFRDYIALRLTDNGSGLTLTLSQAVFSSIWDANGNPQVLGDGLDQLRADIHNIVRTTKHWNVNKA